MERYHYKHHHLVGADHLRLPRRVECSPELSDVDKLERRLAAFGLLDITHSVPINTNKGRVRGFRGFGLEKRVDGRSWEHVYLPHVMVPFMSQRCGYGVGGSLIWTRQLQPQQQRCLFPRPQVVGLRRKGKGTGVFLPRVVQEDTWKSKRRSNSGDVQKINGADVQKKQEEMEELNKKEGDEFDLPKEWTY